MRNLFLLVFIAGMFLQSSCITSLHQLVTPDNIRTDNRVTGTWQGDEIEVVVKQTDEEVIYQLLNTLHWGIRKTPLSGKNKTDSAFYSKAYTISFKKEDITYYMLGAFNHIGNELFMDLKPIILTDPQQPDGSVYELSYSYLPAYSIAKVEWGSNNQLTLKFLNGDYIREQVLNNKMLIRHESDDLFGTFLVTASSNELRQFLQKYSHDERLYSRDYSVILTRKG